MPKKDLTGQVFGKLTVIKDSGQRASNGAIIWECQCECGNITYVVGSNLTRKDINRRTVSCGQCYKGLNLIGEKYNKLTVLAKMDYQTGHSQVWKCQCDCGNITYVNTRNLRSGEVKSCGCLSSSKLKFGEHRDLSNQKFGKLTPIEYLGKSKWKCKCDCGNIIEVFSFNLLRGNSTSCGCSTLIQPGDIFNNLKIIKNTGLIQNKSYLYLCECIICHNTATYTINEITHRQGVFCNNCRIKDLTGQKFGKLTVISLDKEQTMLKHKTYWICQCDCGTIRSFAGSNLQSMNTKSCGCLLAEQDSLGVQQIKHLLQQYNIPFVCEKTFDTCRFPKTQALARFDFYLPTKHVLIEFDGQQHFYENNYFNDNLKDIQERDQYKNNWCKQNNIPLIRIPYTQVNKLTIQDLQITTTQFLV